MTGSGYAFRCGECDTEPLWSIMRKGDVVTDWACDRHFNIIAESMQRDHEITELIVTHRPTILKWAEIRDNLDAVANEGKVRHFCGHYNEPGAKYCANSSCCVELKR